MASLLRVFSQLPWITAVHFRLKGTAVILWGTLPNEFERRLVRTQFDDADKKKKKNGRGNVVDTWDSSAA